MNSNRLLTVDFSNDSVALCVFEKSLKKVNLKDSYFFATDNFKDPLQRDEFIASEIKSFYFKNSTYISNTAILLPRDESLVFFVEFPKTAIENLGNVIDFEIEKYIPFPKKDVVYAYRIIKKTKTSVEVMVTATKRDILNRYLGIFERSGVTLDCAEVKTAALCNCREVFKGVSGTDEILVTAFGNRLELIKFQNGVIVSSKLVLMGGKDDLGTKMSGEIDLLKPAAGKPGIHLIDRRKVTGGAENSYGAFRPVAFDESRVSIGAAPKQREHDLAVSVCCAAGKFGIGDCNMNLLEAEETAEGGLRNAFTALLSAAAIISVALWLVMTFSSHNKAVSTLDGYLSDFKKRAFEVKAISEGTEKTENELLVIQKMVEGDRKIQEVLKELTERTPVDTWLTNFEYKDRKFYLRGVSISASELIFKLDESPMFRDVIFTSSIIKRREGLEEFNIQGEVQ